MILDAVFVEYEEVMHLEIFYDLFLGIILSICKLYPMRILMEKPIPLYNYS
jgi:hypothetical protein